MKKLRPLPPLEIVESYLNYNSETGIGVWKRTSIKNGKMEIGSTAGSIQHNGYIYISFFSKKYAAHRLFWLLYYKQDPGSKFIDHIDRNRLNNKIANLRLVTASENALNATTRLNTHTGIIGVCYHIGKKKFSAQIKINYKQYHLGYFEKIEDAIAARRKAEIMYM
jgi:hypothetical protein